MKVEHIAIMTRVMREGMTIREFLEEAIRSNVPGLPYVDRDAHIAGRISVRHVFKNIAVPDSYLRLADAMGDQTDRLDMSRQRIVRSLALPVETYLLENIPSISPVSSVTKALALMEAHNTHYIFLIEDDRYLGVVTRMLIAERLLEWLDDRHGEPVPDT